MSGGQELLSRLKWPLAGGGAALGIAGAAGIAAGAGPWSVGAALAGAGLAQFALLDFLPKKVPAVMFHSVVGYRPDRPEKFVIWCPPRQFEGMLRYLRWRGFESITLQEMHDHVLHGAPVPEKPIVLTFDDGYADNWIYAGPLMRKYGFRGTVFMPSDFVQEETTPRPTLEDVWAGRLAEEELEPYGYLNRAELRELAQSGLIEVQSHGRSHTWLPTSGRVIDFHRPGLGLRHLRWMWWNRNRSRKPYWFHEMRHEDIPWGTPVYENHLALSRRCAAPDPGLEEHLTAYVAERGGSEFIRREDAGEALRAQVEAYRRDGPEAAIEETDEAFERRLRWELEGSRRTLEEITGREVRFMSWPNGGVCPEALALMRECGYLAATISSRGRQPRNFHGGHADEIGRVSATSFFRDARRVMPWILSFAMKLERNRGNRYMELPIKGIWLYRRFFPPRGEAAVKPAGARE